jgi:thiamine kinase-like enzyme
MLHNTIDILQKAYGIRALYIREVPSGWSAAAYKVLSDSGEFFLKAYDKFKPSVGIWINRIKEYMPVVVWLFKNTPLRDGMTAPLLTSGGAYSCEDENFLYMLFPFINGQTICESKLTAEQTSKLAEIIALLHTYGPEIPVKTDSLREDFDISFCADLCVRLRNMDEKLYKKLAPFSNSVYMKCADLQNAAASLREAKLRFALCHTDIHGWNLMQSENLVLIDWECLKLAPVEADLFSFTDTFFFPYALDDFLSVYRTMHKDYRVNTEAMRFYRLRRRLEDIHAFIHSLQHDRLAQGEKKTTLIT